MLLLKSFTSDDRSIVPPTDDSYLSHQVSSLSLRIRVFHPNTRIYVRLLRPCFQTGRRNHLSGSRRRKRCPSKSPASHTTLHCFPSTWKRRTKGSLRKGVSYTPSIHCTVCLDGYNRNEDPTFRLAFSPHSEMMLTHSVLQDHPN